VVTSVSEVIVIFLQLFLFAAFFSSLLGLVSHSFSESNSGEEIRTRWHCVEKINHLRESSLVLAYNPTNKQWPTNETMAYNPAFHGYSGTLNSSFYAYSPIVDSFVIVCFYVEKHHIPQC